MAWGRFGQARADDDLVPIDDWMDDNNDAVDQKQAYEQAGNDAWSVSTTSGQNLQASRPIDLIALGNSTLDPNDAEGVPNSFSTYDLAGSNFGSGFTDRPPQTAVPDTSPARYVKAANGDSISRLLGTSDPGAIGRFMRLNGLDGDNSTIYAGKVYALSDAGDETAADAALGNRTLGRDNVRLAQRRAQQDAANDLFSARLAAGQNVWTGQAVGAGRTPNPSPDVQPEDRHWWDSDAAKAAGGSAAYLVGAVAGVPIAVYHAAGDVKDTGLFGLHLSGLEGAEAQDQARQQAVDATHAALQYARGAIADPVTVASDIGGAAHRAVDAMSPLNAPMSGTLWDVVKHQFHAGDNFGEAATNVAGLFAGGEVLDGLHAAQTFEATRAANVAKFIDQGASPKLAEYLAQPYEGMGHHSIIPRRAKVPDSIFGVPVDPAVAGRRLPIPSWLSDSPLNVSIPRGMSRGDFYEYHYAVDPKAHGFRLPADLNGGKGWSGKQLGLTKYGRPERIWRGTPVPLKDALATIPLTGGTSLYGQLEAPQ